MPGLGALLGRLIRGLVRRSGYRGRQGGASMAGQGAGPGCGVTGACQGGGLVGSGRLVRGAGHGAG